MSSKKSSGGKPASKQAAKSAPKTGLVQGKALFHGVRAEYKGPGNQPQSRQRTAPPPKKR